MGINIKVFAYGFPALCIAFGALLLFGSQQTKSNDLSTWGGNLIMIGAGLQALYLLLRYGKNLRD